MQGRYGMAIWVSSTASLNLAGSFAKPGAMTYISQGIASWATMVSAMVAAASTAMASPARRSAASSPSRATCSRLPILLSSKASRVISSSPGSSSTSRTSTF